MSAAEKKKAEEDPHALLKQQVKKDAELPSHFENPFAERKEQENAKSAFSRNFSFSHQN